MFFILSSQEESKHINYKIKQLDKLLTTCLQQHGDMSSTSREHLMLSCHLLQGWTQLQTKASPRDTSFLEQPIPKDRVRQGGKASPTVWA